MDYSKLGRIVNYDDKNKTATVRVEIGELKIGDDVRIGEFGVGLEQKVGSIVSTKNNKVTIKVNREVSIADFVYKANN